jgi:hypothetical protein
MAGRVYPGWCGHMILRFGGDDQLERAATDVVPRLREPLLLNVDEASDRPSLWYSLRHALSACRCHAVFEGNKQRVIVTSKQKVPLPLT